MRAKIAMTTHDRTRRAADGHRGDADDKARTPAFGLPFM